MVGRWGKVKERVRKRDRISEWHGELPFHAADVAEEGASITLHQTFLYFN